MAIKQYTNQVVNIPHCHKRPQSNAGVGNYFARGATWPLPTPDIYCPSTRSWVMPRSHLLFGLTQTVISFDSVLLVYRFCAIFHFRNTVTFRLKQKYIYFFLQQQNILISVILTLRCHYIYLNNNHRLVFYKIKWNKPIKPVISE